MDKDIIHKIKSAGLIGRGGAGFPVYLKWLAVYRAMVSREHVHCQVRGADEIYCHFNPDQSPRRKLAYVVVNGTEGEPGVAKDGYILEHHAAELLDGIKIALNFLQADRVYFVLHHDYFNKFSPLLLKLAAERGMAKKLQLIAKPLGAGYIAGEESALLNLIEGKTIEPRLRPPYPTAHGLFNQPTLVNNVETFYDVALVSLGKYLGERFYTISGEVKRPGVYRYPANWPIERVLKESGNYPIWPFFIQVGGDLSGQVLNMEQLNQPATGAASLKIYNLYKHNPHQLLLFWIQTFKKESCGQCAPCREGTYRLLEAIKAPAMNWTLWKDILDNLALSSFCALGSSVPVPLRSYWENIVKKYNFKI